MPDFREKCSETRKVVDSVSVLWVARTTPEIYCEQYGIIFSKTGTVADFKEDNRSETRKVVDSVSVLRVAQDNT